VLLENNITVDVVIPVRFNAHFDEHAVPRLFLGS
jgi:hypothetical protein